MSDKIRPSLRHPSVLLATWFGTGYLRPAPGSWGSAAALPFAWLILHYGNQTTLAVATVLIFIIGVWSANKFCHMANSHDAGEIVIDEVAGQWLTLLFAPLNPIAFLIGFILFRIFDIIKPWPISWLDRKVEGGFGVMIDDILAGIYALICLEAILYYFPTILTWW